MVYTGHMGFFDRVLGIEALPDIAEERSYHSVADPQTAFLLGYAMPGVPTVSDYSAMTLSSVFRAVSLIAGSIAGLPMRTFEQNAKGLPQVVGSFLDTPGAASASNGVRLTTFEWKELVTTYILLHGDCFLQHIYNGAGAVVALNPVHPLCVSVEWDPSRYGGKVYKVHQDDGSTVELDANNMTQIMGLSLDGLRGMSVVSMARLSIGTALSGDKAAHRQFTNGAMISGLVTPVAGEDLTADEAKEVKEVVNRQIMGAENAGDIPVINRTLQFTPWTLSAQDAQFLESRTFQIDEIGRWFGVPPHLLGLTEKSTSWGQGIAEQNRGLSRYTLSNITGRIQERLSTLISDRGRWVEFDYSAFIKPSPEDEIKLLIEQVNSGLLTLNEARAIRNMPPLEGGDLPRIPAGAANPNKDEEAPNKNDSSTDEQPEEEEV